MFNGKLLRKRRNQLGLTAEHLCENVGLITGVNVSISAMYEYETGKEPSYTKGIALAKTLRIKYEDLIVEEV